MDLEVDKRVEKLNKLKPEGVELYMPVMGPTRTKLCHARYRILRFVGIAPNYFMMRHLYMASDRRAGDIAFLLHGMIDHPNEHWIRSVEGWRSAWLMRRYKADVFSYFEHEKSNDEKLRAFADLYREIYFGAYASMAEDHYFHNFHGLVRRFQEYDA